MVREGVRRVDRSPQRCARIHWRTHHSTLPAPPPTGEIDRAALGGIVFADRSRMHALNAIVWPAIEALIEQALNDAADSAPAACDAAGDASAPGAGLIGVVEAAVLLEAGWADRVDSVWVTWAPEEDIIARLQQRNGLSQEAARARIALQVGAGRRALVEAPRMDECAAH